MPRNQTVLVDQAVVDSVVVLVEVRVGVARENEKRLAKGVAIKLQLRITSNYSQRCQPDDRVLIAWGANIVVVRSLGTKLDDKV